VSVGAVSLKRTERHEPGVDFAEHAGAVQSLTRELCAASAWLEPEFTMAALRLAFKRCALKVHPDKARGNDLEFQRPSRRTPLKKRITPRRGP
jgi:hypothetical protein